VKSRQKVFRAKNRGYSLKMVLIEKRFHFVEGKAFTDCQNINYWILISPDIALVKL
jgi:hypothetical protein